jgi:hypothetical protein
MKRLVVVILLFQVLIGYTQQREQVNLDSLGIPFVQNAVLGSGRVVLNLDNRLAYIIQNYVSYLHQRPIIGWRVQIFFATGHGAKEQAMQVLQQFEQAYPKIPAYIFFVQPYFKVRVGNFLTRQEAARFLFQIKDQYPGAFLTEDAIDVNKLTY